MMDVREFNLRPRADFYLAQFNGLNGNQLVDWFNGKRITDQQAELVNQTVYVWDLSSGQNPGDHSLFQWEIGNWWLINYGGFDIYHNDPLLGEVVIPNEAVKGFLVPFKE